ncbi:MAG: hypothetical protein NWF14_01240 [Candidatus Bathyarchaeota archaeon]|nr:hypothetical protein [Candidatus Bathyarchaeota archaeon]
MRNVQRTIAETVSALLNAPLVALYTFVFVIFSLLHSASISFLIISSFFGSIFPIALTLYLAKKRIIPDIYASERRTRTKPFIGAVASYLLGVMALVLFRAPQILVSLMVCYLINSLVILIITQVWKISIHASGITGPATFLVHQVGVGMLPLFALLFPVGWARIKLGAHDFNQVVAGALLTTGLTFLQLELALTPTF